VQLLLNDAAGCCVSPPEQLSALRTLYIGFRKAKLKKSKRETQKRTWDSASLRSKTLRVMLILFLGMAAVVCLQV
jgi:hypothetical protein